jgi:BirA family biotin operon repressor/biotin-[acetyl-CoA-carboxylase] ligase
VKPPPQSGHSFLPPLRILESVASTQDYCLHAVQEGATEEFAVLAREQTGGRGSRGRHWQSLRGNLHLSVLLREPLPLQQAAGFALLAGLALLEALERFLPAEGTKLHLKWPNDVLFEGRKLGGVLIDTIGGASGRLAFLVIGFGANLAIAPSLPDRPTAALAELIAPPAPEAVAHAVLAQLWYWRCRRAHEGWSAIRTAWLARAHPLRSRLTVCVGEEIVAGEFAGLTEGFALILDTQAGTRSFATGEIFLGQPHLAPAFSAPATEEKENNAARD